MQAVKHRLRKKAGRAAYTIRKQTVGPVFGIIKSVMGFRQFSLRGLRKVTGIWNLVCLAWNVKRMAVLRRKRAHDKAFYQLFTYMEPDYHQRKFELRLYLTHQDHGGVHLWKPPSAFNGKGRKMVKFKGHFHQPPSTR